MIKLKTKKDIEKLCRGGRILSQVMDRVEAKIQPGANTETLTNLTEELIKKYGGRPRF